MSSVHIFRAAMPGVYAHSGALSLSPYIPFLLSKLIIARVCVRNGACSILILLPVDIDEGTNPTPYSLRHISPAAIWPPSCAHNQEENVKTGGDWAAYIYTCGMEG